MINLSVYNNRDLNNATALLNDAIKYDVSIFELLDKIKKQIELNRKGLIVPVNNEYNNEEKHICKEHGEMEFCSVNKIWYCKKCFYSELP